MRIRTVAVHGLRIGLSLLPCLAVCALSEAASPGSVEGFNYVLGTQTIGARYQFSEETRLVETAKAIVEMGSNVLKFQMGPKYEANNYASGRREEVKDLATLAEHEPSVRAVLDMPFAHYHIWAYCFEAGWWADGFTDAEQEAEYREVRELAEYLLRRYSGSGKTFLLGHWEGDWYLHPNYNAQAEPDAGIMDAMVRWLNVRQKAIDDAKRAVPHSDVELYHYTEVNLVKKALEGKACLTNDVLPRAEVDYVSYSAYDITVPNRGRTREALHQALNHIESKLPPKPGIKGKRVFIGEYGFPLELAGTPEQQDRDAREVASAGLEWGCPYVLYWQLYCNEVKEGKHRGFWLIDDQGRRQPFYNTLRRFYVRSREAVADYQRTHNRLPTAEEFAEMSRQLLL